MPKRALDISELLYKVPFKPEIVSLHNQNFPYMRVEIPIPELDLLEWLEAQKLYPKIYFETPKTGLKIAGIGEAFSLDEIPSFEKTKASPRFFGGMDFLKRKKNTWGQFPSCRYVLPLIEVEKRGDLTYLCLNRTSEELPIKNLESLNFEAPPFESFNCQPKGRLDSPSFPVWDRNIRESLTNINQEKLDKIVLARASLFNFEYDLSPLMICKMLQGKSPSATVFTFEFTEGQGFVGASPESLYQRNHNHIKTAAIAGTRPRGKTEAEDQALKEDLLNDEKELHEFDVVKQDIQKCLEPLCSSFSSKNNSRIIQTSTVQHIHHTFEGQLLDDINDKKLIEALHPTPAVGGRPKKIALKNIGERETFDRGWYSAPVGWISPENAHLLVAIRSALVQKNELRLFAGTGIVPGSLPQKEWEELEHKISQFILW